MSINLNRDMTDGKDTTTEDSETSYAVKLPAFEGPLDLLLHLIKKNEINIYDIPIAPIAQQYLDYLKLMKTFNLSIAGEFIVMAATLIYIKSKMLLPIEQMPSEEIEEDPRAELVRRLLEYKQFKEAASTLGEREQEWRDVFRREEGADNGHEVALTDLNLFDLLDALQKLLETVPSKRSVDILVDELSVKDKMSVILGELSATDQAKGIAFFSLFSRDGTRAEIIVTFLALLELIRLRLVWIQQSDPFGPILIFKSQDATVSQSEEEEINGGSGS
jgi:segregation and condensation protein A